MKTTAALDARRERGRRLRKTVARKAHAALGAPGALDRDPVALLEASARGRLAGLLPLRHERMAASPLAFFRGSAALQAHDLAGAPHTGLVQQICGDSHLMNFGGFATPERQIVFGLSDFDETHPGPWECDVKRLAASFVLAARHLGFGRDAGDEAVQALAGSYGRRMARYARLGALDLWYEKITPERVIAEAADATARRVTARLAAKARKQTGERLLPTMARKVGGRWTMEDAPPTLFHLHGAGTQFEPDDDWMRLDDPGRLSAALFDGYLATLSPSHRALLGRFGMHDLAFKVVGVGSVGLRCLVLLLIDDQEQPLFLQIKEAVPSVLAPHVPAAPSPFAHQGQRVVAGQRLMQSSSDYFLGWSTGPSGRHFHLRQLRDMKISPDVEGFDAPLLEQYARLCGWALARAHARAGGLAPEIAAYLGRGESFADALTAYARGYAGVVERDFSRFRQACRSGRLPMPAR